MGECIIITQKRRWKGEKKRKIEREREREREGGREGEKGRKKGRDGGRWRKMKRERERDRKREILTTRILTTSAVESDRLLLMNKSIALNMAPNEPINSTYNPPKTHSKLS